MKKLLLLMGIGLVMGSCTENQRARAWGGTSTVHLKAGEELINATWKESDLWLLTKERPAGQAPSTYYFSEDSSYGVMEGTIIIREK